MPGKIVGKKSVKYRIENLDCAHCAANLERKLNKADFKVEVNFATSTLIIHSENVDEETLKKRISSIESDVSIIPVEVSKPGNHHGDIYRPYKDVRLWKLGVSLVLFTTGLVLKQYGVVFRGVDLSVSVLLGGYLVAGYDVILRAFKNIFKGNFFDETFLMTVASFGAIALGEIPEALAVMMFFGMGEYFESRALSNSRKLIKSLIEIQPETARVKSGGTFVEMSPENVSVGSRIQVRAGEKIPLDGVVLSGSSTLDTSVLTGESMPREVFPGSEVMAGMINKLGVIEIEVKIPYADSSVSKMVKLIENANSKKTRTEKFITSFSKKYTPAVLAVSLFIAFAMPFLTNMNFSEWISRALVILVISCPCAFVISVPLGYFSGIGASSARGILVKGSFVFDVVGKIRKFVFDKTGTLTKGEFELVETKSLDECRTNDELIKIAASVENHSSHPIAQGIKNAYEGELYEVREVEEIPGRGIFGKIGEDEVWLGNHKMIEDMGFKPRSDKAGILNLVYDGKYIGWFRVADRMRDDAGPVLKKMKSLGVEQTVMLTGDGYSIANSIAWESGVDEFISDLLPDEKYVEVERIKDSLNGKGKVAFVGDGINDAPSIARADLGIAMGIKGSDLAVESADVVIMGEKLKSILDLYSISKMTTAVVWQNILFAFFIKALFISLGAFGFATMWGAVFADVGVTLIAILNSRRILRKFK